MNHMTTNTTQTESRATTATATMTRPVVGTVRTTKKGWHDDPRGEHKMRFHDGVAWTEHTTHFGPVPCTGCRH